VLIGGVCAIIFGERSEDWTRGGMLIVALGAAMVALGLLALANWIRLGCRHVWIGAPFGDRVLGVPRRDWGSDLRQVARNRDGRR
jgi:hypothetical protein